MTELWICFFGIMILAGWAVFHEPTQTTEPQAKPSQRKIIRNGGGLYLVDIGLGRVLDIGRGLTMSLQDGIESEVNQDVLTWEGRRRILHSAPSVNMTLVKQALGVDDGALPPLLPGGQDGSFLPVLTEFKMEVDDE